jgi:PAS domain-containing protein
MLRHKRILIAIRFVFLILISSIAVPSLRRGDVSIVLPIILAAYFLTNVAMIPEQRQAFFQQRIQAFLLLFDIFVLVVSMYYLEEYRQELFLAMYVSEAVAREHRVRQEAEDRITKELRGMSRFQALASNMMAETDTSRLFLSIADAAREFLGCPYTAIFWIAHGDAKFEAALSEGFPPALAARWKGSDPATTPVGKSFKAGRVLRFTRQSGEAWLNEPDVPIDEILVAPFSDRAGGLQGSLVIVWTPPHPHFAAEEEAAQLMVQQAGVSLENASLYQMLAQTRDIWQAAFQSIPTPVVIVDAKSRIVQANPAFLALGDFDFATLMGSSFDDVLQGAAYPNGSRAFEGNTPPVAFDAARLTIPKLNGEFDVTRGPYIGANDAGSGTVWVLRKLESEMTTK